MDVEEDSKQSTDEVCAEEVFRELMEPIASFLDVSSVGKLLQVSTDGLPFSFDYEKYVREKIVFQYPLSRQVITPDCEHPDLCSRFGITAIGTEGVIIVGGHNRRHGNFIRRNGIWFFDAKSEKFHKIMPVKGKEPPAISRVALQYFNGLVYAFGGILQDKQKVNSVCTFSLDTREWNEVSVTGTPPSSRCDALTCKYTWVNRRGFIVFSGSQEGLIYTSDVYFFSVKTQNTPPPDRIGSTMTLIGDKLYVCEEIRADDSRYIYGGGRWCVETNSHDVIFHEMWCLHLGQGPWRWEKLNCTGEPPYTLPINLASIAIGNHILIDGALTSSAQPILYDTISQTWRVIPILPMNEVKYGTAYLLAGSIYYFLGYNRWHQVKDIDKISIDAITEFIQNGTLFIPKEVDKEPSQENSVEGMEEDEEEEVVVVGETEELDSD